MSLLRVLEDRGYWPEYGTFLVRDEDGPGQVRPLISGLLAEYAVDTQPCGSIARAGDGWLDGIGADEHHAVRIEVHDARPDVDNLAEWDDVVELPFASAGVVSLAAVTGGPAGESIEIGTPGLYRVHFARRAMVPGADARDSACEYQLRFWPVDAPAQPPRWLRRSRPLVEAKIDTRDTSYGAYPGAVSDVVMLALWAAESATPVTLTWLADRLLTTTAAVRAIIGHPKARGVLSVYGDLDDVEAVLAVTIHPRSVERARAYSPAVRAPRPTAARTTTHGSPARRASPGIQTAAGVRAVPAKPAIAREAAAAGDEKQSTSDGLDGNAEEAGGAR